VNQRSKCEDSFTPLHFATFNGNLGLVEYIIKKGGDPFAENRSKINMLHVAAQGDQALTLAYFIRIGLDVNSRDSR
jgi:ankyrin repeat protein